MCSYVELIQNREITAREIKLNFGFKDHHTVLKKINRVDCLNYTTRIIGDKNKKQYIVTHSKMVHDALKYSKINETILGQKKDHLVTGFVETWQKDFYEHLRLSEKFNKAIDFEVHGLRYITNPLKELPFMKQEHFILKWKYCDIEVNAWEGRLLVWTKPKTKRSKYGLNKLRYEEFIKWRDLELKKFFGYDVGWLLEPIQFDLHQDDWRFEWKGKHEERNMINGLLLQRYKVKRTDRIEDQDRYIKRFELRFKTRKSIRDYSSSIPYVLSLDVDHVLSMTAVIDLTQELKTHIDYFSNLSNNWVRSMETTKLDNIKEALQDLQFETEASNQIESIGHILEQVNSLKDDIDHETQETTIYRNTQSQIDLRQTRILENVNTNQNQMKDGIETLHEEIEYTRSDLNRLVKIPISFMNKVKQKFRRN